MRVKISDHSVNNGHTPWDNENIFYSNFEFSAGGISMILYAEILIFLDNRSS